MKVILLQDVPKVGRRYDVKEVSGGYARNFLFPRKLAEQATDAAIKKIDTLKAQRAAEKKVREDLLIKNLEDIKESTITIKERANKKGHLFAGIHKEELIKYIKEQTRLDVDTDHIVLEKPIKEVGEYEIPVVVGKKETVFKLIIEAEEEA